jgi:aa3 type cytochrome c oxidase subunit IV
MAEGAYEHGHMDVHQQEQTFHAFIRLSKWGSLYIAVGILFLALWFCTDAGFFGGLIASVVVLIIGTLLLRERKGPKSLH